MPEMNLTMVNEPSSAEQIRRATARVKASVTDPEEQAEILAMLGLSDLSDSESTSVA